MEICETCGYECSLQDASDYDESLHWWLRCPVCDWEWDATTEDSPMYMRDPINLEDKRVETVWADDMALSLSPAS